MSCRTLLVVLFALAAVLISPLAAAQPMANPGDKTKARQVKLAVRDGEPGKWARVEQRLRGDKEARVFVRGLDVAAPLSVQVVAERLDAPVQVSLHRQAWGEALEKGSTGSAGLFRFDGRAYGDVGVKLRSETGEPVRATVLFWQGDPVPRPLAAVYAAPGTERARAGGMEGGGRAGGGRTLLWLGIGALAVALAAGALWFLRGRRGATSVAVLALVLGGALGSAPQEAVAQGVNNPFEVPPDRKNDPKTPKEAPVGKNPPKPADKPGDPLKPDLSDGDPLKPDLSDQDGENRKNDPKTPKEERNRKNPPKDQEKPDPSSEDPLKPDLSDGDPLKPDLSDDDASDVAEGEDGGAPDGSYRERLEAAEAHARELAQQVADNRAELERLRMLIESDREREPDPSNFPPMPLTCRPPSVGGDGMVMAARDRDPAWQHYENCQACYVQPLADFENQLLLYERLRTIYTGARDDKNRSIMIGDGVPKPHPLLENAWSTQKFVIEKAFLETRKAYDVKLEEFNDNLSSILDRIGECETKYNNNPHWRETSGLFFHRTMATSYKRTD